MNEDILALLAVHEYFRGTSDTARRDVLEVGRVRNFAPGDVVYQPEDSFAFRRLRAPRSSEVGQG